MRYPEGMIWLAAPPDAASTGRYAERWTGKLSDADRARVAADRGAGATLRELASRYGVSHETIREVSRAQENQK